MITIKLQKALFHPQPQLEVDDEEVRFVSGIFTEPLKVAVSKACFVDPAMAEPDPQPVPTVVPRIPVLRTGSAANHKPNTCLTFSSPVRVPPVKRTQTGTVPFSVAKARNGEVWIDGIMIGCSDPEQAHELLRTSGTRAVASVPVAFSEAYGTANAGVSPEPPALTSGKDFYSQEPPKRSQ